MRLSEKKQISCALFFGSLPAKDQWVPHTPGFSIGLVRPTNFLRLSLTKAAHAVTDRTTHRKSGYLARLSRDVGNANLNVLCQWGGKVAGGAKWYPMPIGTKRSANKTRFILPWVGNAGG
jgi:hypothetical protein